MTTPTAMAGWLRSKLPIPRIFDTLMTAEQYSAYVSDLD